MNLKAIILAAGRGERMRPLTDTIPKPLLQVHGKPLIEWHLEALARDGVREVVINTAWLEDQIVEALGNGSRWGLQIHYSMEGRDHGGALETAGGVAKALPLLVDSHCDSFWLISGDAFLPGFKFDATTAQRFQQSDKLAHLWMVPNAPHHPTGDFGIDAAGLASLDARPHLTWASIGLFRAELVARVSVGQKRALKPLFHAAMADELISAERYDGPWTDVGTIERLESLNAT